MRHRHGKNQGFTLIELSIALVIIGLIIGGVLVGQDLIKQAQTQSQITQIGKYNQAVNTFKTKYAGIPGDIDPTSAGNFGFTVGTSCTGQQGGRDGNGLIDGYVGEPLMQGIGETGLFWQDLSAANMIDGIFPNNGAASIGCILPAANVGLTPGSAYLGDYYPVGKIGYGTFIYVYEYNGANWFGISTPTSQGPGVNLFSGVSIPVSQAYNIDKKIDDGMPLTGSVTAAYLNDNATTGSTPSYSPNSASDTSFTCYNTSTPTGVYSTSISNGSGPNCGLSFKMQGAAR
jgi:prepilin-type N-terminal cleavage/methylation domain-containing protein